MTSDGILGRVRDALRGVFLTHIPDHPANGGNTGETEWPPDGGDPDVTEEQDNGDEK